MIYFTNETGSCKTTVQFWQKVHGVDITHDNVCSSMLSCFYSHLLSTRRPISSFSDPPVDIFVEKGELSNQDPDATVTDPNQTLSEEQNYRETMKGIRSYKLGWSHIPDMDNTASAEDNPFASPKSQPSGKVSVCMPTDDWLCNKLKKLNLTLVEGYLSRSSKASRLNSTYSRIARGGACVASNPPVSRQN